MARTQDVLDHPVTRAVSGTALVGGVVVAVVVSLSALVSPLPVTTIREPVIVDTAPGLPTDQEPTTGWPAPSGDDAPAPSDDTPLTDPAQDGRPDGNGVAPVGPGGDDATDDVLDDPGDDLGDTLDEVLDEPVGDVTDTVDDVADDVTSTVDDVTDAVGEAAAPVGEVVDDTVGGVVDDTVGGALDDATGGLLP